MHALRIILLTSAAVCFLSRAEAADKVAAFSELPRGDELHMTLAISGSFHQASSELTFQRSAAITVRAVQFERKWSHQLKASTSTNRITLGELSLTKADAEGLDRLLRNDRVPSSLARGQAFHLGSQFLDLLPGGDVLFDASGKSPGKLADQEFGPCRIGDDFVDTRVVDSVNQHLVRHRNYRCTPGFLIEHAELAENGYCIHCTHDLLLRTGSPEYLHRAEPQDVHGFVRRGLFDDDVLVGVDAYQVSEGFNLFLWNSIFGVQFFRRYGIPFNERSLFFV